ncbi:DNA polymerase I [Patescibacteria group bacterium]|nr:DNA polymerase I [Patescibacteria group bacterium]
MADQKTFLILDGNALLHRAWHAIPPLATKDGRIVNAVYGFANVIEKMLATYKPNYMSVAWDLPGGTFRHEEYVEYKAQREKKADELYAQIPMIQDLLKGYGIPSLSAEGFEADDILGTVSEMNKVQGSLRTLIITGDLDALQLVDDQTNIVVFVKGLSEVKHYDEQAVRARYGLTPAQLIDYKTLIGDTSDNLPGVAGIGEKTAVALLQEYGTLDNALISLNDATLPEKFAKKLHKQERVIKLMRRLVTIVRDVPLPDFSYEASEIKPVEVARLLPLLRDFEFKKLVAKYESLESAPLTPKIHIEKNETAPVIKPKAKKTVAKKPSARASIALDDLTGERLALIISKKPTDLFGGAMSAVALVGDNGAHLIENPDSTHLKLIALKCSQAQTIIAHDVKGMMHAFHDAGADLVKHIRDKEFIDTMVIAYLLSSSGRGLTFAEVANDALSLTLSLETPIADCVAHQVALADWQIRKLAEDGMAALYRDTEAPLIPVLFSMERNGLLVDKVKLKDLSNEFEEAIKGLEKKIFKFAKREFNVNSPSQLADVLFIDLGLPTKGIKKTKTGFSTAAPELEKLEDEHDIIPLISEYREIAKLKSTYADALPEQIASDGRVHTTLNQTVAATGRLSSSNPNLQNIPIRSALGREIRCAFIAPEGSQLISADYSQIELRLAAIMANDAPFIKAFADGADIHKRTAAEIYEVPEEEVTKDQRAAAKAINFSILYGVGARSLARATGLTFDEAKKFIAKYFEVHPGIAQYMDAMKLKARTDGYVETMFGRRRYLPDIHSGMPQLIASAERMAINMPIQGTQADIIKKSMITIDAYLREKNLKTKMVLQVHDELVFEAPQAEIDTIAMEIPKLMAEVVDLTVPLVTDVAVAKSWGEME